MVRNVSPLRDGFHDPENEGTRLLQSPAEAFVGWASASGGNFVNWSEALRSRRIAPRYERADNSARPNPLALDIVREVRGFTPPAVFPHAPHAEWIDCPVCHPALFKPLRGGNSMTMAEIMLGQKCGVCHGTVAFPVAECRRCHYRPPVSAIKRTTASDSTRAKQRGGSLTPALTRP